MTDKLDSASNRYYDFSIKTGSTQPNIEAQLLDNDETPIDNLSGASVRFKMVDDGDGTVYVDAACTITDATDAIVEYSWVDGDTDVAGNHNAEFSVDYSGATGANFEADEYFPSDGYLDIEISESL